MTIGVFFNGSLILDIYIYTGRRKLRHNKYLTTKRFDIQIEATD